MDVYLDEDVPSEYDEAFLRVGWRALPTRDAGNRGRNDAYQLKYSASLPAPMMTLNWKDFRILSDIRTALAAWSVLSIGHAGILSHPLSRNPARPLSFTPDDFVAAVVELVAGGNMLENTHWFWDGHNWSVKGVFRGL